MVPRRAHLLPHTVVLIALAGALAGCGGDAASGDGADAGGGGDIHFVADAARGDVARADAAPDGGVDAPGGPDVAAPPDVPTVPDVPVGPDIRADVPPDVPAPPPLTDQDGDRVPDIADRWPTDANWPGVARTAFVYVHTATELFRMDVKSFVIERVGAFGWPATGGGSQEMTDIAIDRWGVLYAISFDTLHICHPETAACRSLGPLPGSFNGLTLVPGPVFGSATDVLIGISNEGGWYRLDTTVGVQATWLGDYVNSNGDHYCSSGDAFSAEGVGTFATVKRGTYPCGDFQDDVLVSLDPRTGRVLVEVTTLEGFQDLWGLAGWREQVYAYDETGAVVFIDLVRAIVRTVETDTGHNWWGAGTRTLFPEED